MLVEKYGSIFTTKMNVMGHGVNCKGIFGSGIAVKMHETFPSIYLPYKKVCWPGRMNPGKVLPVDVHIKRSVIGTDPKDSTVIKEISECPPSKQILTVLNIATQIETGNSATYEYVELGMRNALEWCRKNGHTGLAIPKIGCGVGGLLWENLRDPRAISVKNILLCLSKEFPDITIELWHFQEAEYS